MYIYLWNVLLGDYLLKVEDNIGVMNMTLGLGLLYATFAVTGMAYTLKATGNSILPTSIVCLYDPAQIFFTILFTFIFYDKFINWQQGIGVALIVSGMLLVNCLRNTDEDDVDEVKDTPSNSVLSSGDNIQSNLIVPTPQRI